MTGATPMERCEASRRRRYGPGYRHRPERQRDEESAEPHDPGADIEPGVAGERVVDQTSGEWSRRHAEAAGHGGSADHGTHHPQRKDFARENGIERHGAGVDEAEH